jgi:hypothetical protein
MDIAQFVITTVVAVIGLYLAQSLTRQQRLKIAEQRVRAYRKLWSLMFVARPSRVEPPDNEEPITPQDAAELRKEITKWYFEDGQGMLLPRDTREMYLQVKERLGRYALEDEDGEWKEAGLRVMHELSIFRSQMKSDLDIYGVIYYKKPTRADKEFIRASGLDPGRWGRPWYRWVTSPRYWATRIRKTHPPS